MTTEALFEKFLEHLDDIITSTQNGGDNLGTGTSTERT